MQQALIVDDSKTARVSLRKMLDKHHIDSALVECAEDALDYLREHRPSMIFMDHMMPGMDGFEAVKAIKADPEKATIPIVMYTTQQGDIYVGQARALGAADILSKPANDEALTQVLDRINKILDDQVTTNTASMQAVTDSVAAINEEPDIVQVAPPVEEAVSSGDTDQIEYHQVTDEQPSFFGLSLRQVAMLLVWLVPIVWVLVLYISTKSEHTRLLSERESLYKSLEWALNQNEGYDYGEAPMARQRLHTLEGLVSHLAAAGFTGTIRLEGHAGEFCLTKIEADNGGVVDMLPAAQLSLSECTAIGGSAEKMLELSGRQSEEFKRFLTTSPLLESSGINVEIVRYGASYPKFEYPQILESTTVGDWNAVALSNNRVKFVLIPE